MSTIPGVWTAPSQMLPALADTTVGWFNTIMGSVSQAITVEAYNIAAFCSLLIRAVAFPTGRLLTVMVKED